MFNGLLMCFWLLCSAVCVRGPGGPGDPGTGGSLVLMCRIVFLLLRGEGIHCCTFPVP